MKHQRFLCVAAGQINMPRTTVRRRTRHQRGHADAAPRLAQTIAKVRAQSRGRQASMARRLAPADDLHELPVAQA